MLGTPLFDQGSVGQVDFRVVKPAQPGEMNGPRTESEEARQVLWRRLANLQPGRHPKAGTRPCASDPVRAPAICLHADRQLGRVGFAPSQFRRPDAGLCRLARLLLTAPEKAPTAVRGAPGCSARAGRAHCRERGIIPAAATRGPGRCSYRVRISDAGGEVLDVQGGPSGINAAQPRLRAIAAILAATAALIDERRRAIRDPLKRPGPPEPARPDIQPDKPAGLPGRASIPRLRDRPRSRRRASLRFDLTEAARTLADGLIRHADGVGESAAPFQNTDYRSAGRLFAALFRPARQS